MKATRRLAHTLCTGIVATTVTLGHPGSALAAPPVGPEQRSVVIHTVEKKPNDELGVLKLAQYDNTTTARSGDITITSVNYFELCSMPCGVPIDVSERPVLFFVRDGSPVSHGFRIPKGADEFTIKVQPGKSGMRVAGILMTAMIVLFPVGVPLLIAGNPRTWIAEGKPADDNEFVRLKKAKRQ